MDKYGKFDESIQGKLSDINIDLSEGILDSIIESELLKQIPIIKILISILEISDSLRQRSFYKKIYKFLYELDKVSKEEKDKFIKYLESKGDKKRVYDNILLILDRFDDETKSTISGKLFKSLIERNIDITMFFRLMNIVEKIYIGDLDLLNKRYSQFDKFDFEESSLYENEYVKENLANHGLLKRFFSQDNRLDKYRGTLSDNVIINDYGLSEIGELLLKYGF